MAEVEAALYLIPVNISDAPLESVLPSGNTAIIRGIRHFIVGNVRTARRFLRRCDRTFDIGASEFHELNGHTDLREVSSWLEPLRRGGPVAVAFEYPDGADGLGLQRPGVRFPRLSADRGG